VASSPLGVGLYVGGLGLGIGIAKMVLLTSLAADPLGGQTSWTADPPGGHPAGRMLCRDPVHHLSSSGDLDSHGDGSADPLGGHTPEVDGALSEAQAAIRSSADLRGAAAKLLGAADEMLKTVMNAVNSGLTRKIAETNDLKVGLFVAACDLSWLAF